MALFEEIEEPPSHGDEEKTKVKRAFVFQNKNYLKKYFLFLNNDKLALQNRLKDSVLMCKNSCFALKDFFSGNYLPHIAIVGIALLVFISNVNDKIVARAFSNDLVEVDPDTQMAVVEQVDQYTPVVNGDANYLEKSISAAPSEGFLSVSGSVETILTMREEPLPDNSKSEVYYVVKNGDTLSGLGSKFGVKLATLKYINDIDNINTIKPGARIKIPVRGYEVPASMIAKKEQDKQTKLAAANRNTVTRSSSSSRIPTVKTTAGSKYNGYPYGYCTYYVATRRQVPSSWGDAKQWLGSARRAGYETGSAPAAGAIMVSSESWWGHVSFVESVDGDQITISEMNYKGWGITSRRTLSASSGVVRGFIY